MPESDTVTKVAKWADPPPARSRRYDWNAIAKQLRRKPEEWALVFEDDKASIATAIRAGSVSAVTPSKGFEVRTSNNVREPERRCSMYMRYVSANDKEK